MRLFYIYCPETNKFLEYDKNINDVFTEETLKSILKSELGNNPDYKPQILEIHEVKDLLSEEEIKEATKEVTKDTEKLYTLKLTEHEIECCSGALEVETQTDSRMAHGYNDKGKNYLLDLARRINKQLKNQLKNGKFEHYETKDECFLLEGK